MTHHTVGMLHVQQLALGRLREGDRPRDTTMNTRKKMKLGASISDFGEVEGVVVVGKLVVGWLL